MAKQQVGKQDSHVSSSTILAQSSRFGLSFTARLLFPFFFLLLPFITSALLRSGRRQ